MSKKMGFLPVADWPAFIAAHATGNGKRGEEKKKKEWGRRPRNTLRLR
jgi:hypothetical protein